MATKHWGRDAYFNDPIATYGGNNAFDMLLRYHMLRAAGFVWLWECDGEVGPSGTNPNHCDDGNMEEAGRAKWADVGTPTITKDTAVVRVGTQSLKVVTDAPGEGVRSAALLTVTNPSTFTGAGSDNITGPSNGIMTIYDAGGGIGTKDYTNCRMVCTGFANAANNGTFLVKDSYYNTTNTDRYLKLFNAAGVAQSDLSTGAGVTILFQRKYEIAVWAYNVAGVSLGVEVDPGDGAFVSVGSIPVDAGGWRLYHFSFYAVSTGSRYVRVLDPTGGNTFYIDGLSVFRSLFEYAPVNVSGTDGILTNPNRFSTGGSYTCGAKDIDKYLFVWDDDHNKNTGYYKITGDLGGGVVTVDMRSGTAAFTTHATANLNWRIVDIECQAHNDSIPASMGSAGFGLQSPHVSGWRYFERFYGVPTTGSKSVVVWCAPDDEADFDFNTGFFLKNGPSSQRNYDLTWSTGDMTSKHSFCGMYIAGGTMTTRNWFMTDADRSFFTFVKFTTSLSHQGCVVVGYTGADVDHPGIEEFVALIRWESDSSYDDIGWSDSGHFTYSGITFDPDGIAVTCCSPVLGYGATAAYVLGASNAGPNPWSSKEWIHPLIIERDPYVSKGCPSERDSDIGIFCSRANMSNLVTFDSNNYLHFTSMLTWEWSGEAIM